MKDFFGVFICLMVFYAIPLLVEEFTLHPGTVSIMKLAQRIFYILAAIVNSLILVNAVDGIRNSDTSQIVGGGIMATVAWFFFYRHFVNNAYEREKSEEVERERVEAMSPAELKRHKAEQAAIEKRAQEKQNENYYGKINSQLICPHCQTKGFVRKQSRTRVTKTRVNSIPARAIGLGTNTENKVTAMRCDNCETQWDVA